MSKAMHVALFEQFDVKARKFFKRYRQRCISVQGMAFILEQLNKMAKKKGKPLTFLELGAGYSTMCFERSRDVGLLISVEHSAPWRQFVIRNLGVCTPIVGREYMKEWIIYPNAVLVDQGPTMQTRLDDLPWVVNYLMPIAADAPGVIFFDDWTPTWSKRVIEVMDELGDWSYQVGGKCHKKSVAMAIHTRTSGK